MAVDLIINKSQEILQQRQELREVALESAAKLESMMSNLPAHGSISGAAQNVQIGEGDDLLDDVLTRASEASSRVAQAKTAIADLEGELENAIKQRQTKRLIIGVGVLLLLVIFVMMN